MAKKKAGDKVTKAGARPVAHPVRIELSSENKAILDRIVEHLGLSRSAYFRMIMLADARRRGFLKDEEAK